MQHVGTLFLDCTASHFKKLLFLIVKCPRFVVLYRNYRKSSEAHYSQCNHKVATERDIQCIFKLLHEPVRQRYIEIQVHIYVTSFVKILKLLLYSIFAIVVRKYFQSD